MQRADKWGLSGIQGLDRPTERLVAVALHRDLEQMEYKRQHPEPAFSRSLHDAVLAEPRPRRARRGARILTALQLGRMQRAVVSSTRKSIELVVNCSYWPSVRTRLNRATAGLWGRSPVSKKARMWELKIRMWPRRYVTRAKPDGRGTRFLAPIYGWFSEGFSTRELQIARTLLDTLSMSNKAV